MPGIFEMLGIFLWLKISLDNKQNIIKLQPITCQNKNLTNALDLKNGES